MTPSEAARARRQPILGRRTDIAIIAQNKAASLRRECKPWKAERAKAMRADMTPAEAALWRFIERRRLGVKARRQVVIRGFIVDFYIPKWRLVVELDGAVHDHPIDRDKDARRDAAIAAVGLRVIRFPNQAIFDHPQRVLAEIRQAALHF